MRVSLGGTPFDETRGCFLLRTGDCLRGGGPGSGASDQVPGDGWGIGPCAAVGGPKDRGVPVRGRTIPAGVARKVLGAGASEFDPRTDLYGEMREVLGGA